MAEKHNSQVLQKTRYHSLVGRLGIGLLIGVGCIALAFYIVAHWVDRQVLHTDNWVELVAPLPKEPEVSEALGAHIATTIFANTDIEQEVADALPPRAAFLAGPLTDELRTVATETSQRLVASDAFQDVWTAANRLAMNRLLTTARSERPTIQSEVNQRFNVNLSDIRSELESRLGSTAEAFPSLNSRDGQQISLDVNLKARQEKVRQYVRTIDFLAAVLPVLAITCFLLVLAVSLRRRQALLTIVAVTASLLLIELVALKVLRQQVLNEVQNANYESAVGVAYDTIVSSLQQAIYTGLVILALVFIGCLLGGPAKWATKLRSYVRVDRLRQGKLFEWWHVVRIQTNQYKYYLWISIVILLLLYLAFLATINWRTGINSVLVACSLGAIIYIIATPRLVVVKRTA